MRMHGPTSDKLASRSMLNIGRLAHLAIGAQEASSRQTTSVPRGALAMCMLRLYTIQR